MQFYLFLENDVTVVRMLYGMFFLGRTVAILCPVLFVY